MGADYFYAAGFAQQARQALKRQRLIIYQVGSDSAHAAFRTLNGSESETAVPAWDESMYSLAVSP